MESMRMFLNVILEWFGQSLVGRAVNFVIDAISRNFKKTQKILDGYVTLEGTQALAELPTECNVFYPQPFRSTPNLDIDFIEEHRGPRGRMGVGGDSPKRHKYVILEQRPDGFRIRIESTGCTKPRLYWRARGQLASSRDDES